MTGRFIERFLPSRDDRGVPRGVAARRSRPWRLACAWCLLCASSTSFAADSPLKGLAVYPPDVHLTGRQDLQRFIVVATREDGVTLDVTTVASAAVKDAGIALLEGNVLRGAADGATTLEISHGGLTTSATIDVKEVANQPPISFTNDVMPVFSKAGCNTGSCHGAARGKDGFRLSIFGYDPQGDYFRITREIGVRRINLALPDQSLLVQKATGNVPHTGGKLFDKDSEYYRILMTWLEAGAPIDAAEPPSVVGVDLYPPHAVIEGEQTAQQFIARARYSDGTDRDVTTLARFDSNNSNSLTITQEGMSQAGARGEAFVSARYDIVSVGSQVLVLPKDLHYEAPAITGNYIDELIGAKLQRLRVLPSELCTDEEFLRRVTLDIVGLLPTFEEYQEFLADTDPAKRAKLIDRLLARKEFAEIWAMKWSELLMVKSSPEVSYKSAFLYSNWLTSKIAEGVPLDQMVRELLSATGGTFGNPATNFYQIERDTLKTSENVAQVFMGIRTQCAQCHNHPFDRWTMNDYYQFAAFFSQIGRKQGEDYRETVVFNQGGGEVAHPVTGQAMPPKFLGGSVPDMQGRDRRAVMAEWLTSPDNPLFATSVANRVWAHFFGVGIVEPVDDIRVSNPPSNPELFNELGTRLRDYKFDFKQLVRDICNSHAYQRSSVRNPTNESDERNYAHANVRRIRAEMLSDCISQVTETKEKFRGLPLGARAVQIADGQTSTYFLTTFGRAPRNTVCTDEVSTDPSLSQALHMLNGAAATSKIAEGGLIARHLAAGQTPEQIIERLFIRALTRRPTPDETRQLMEIVSQAENPDVGLQDVFWAVLNSREFVFNH